MHRTAHGETQSIQPDHESSAPSGGRHKLEATLTVLVRHHCLGSDAIGRLATHTGLLVCARRIGECLSAMRPGPVCVGGALSAEGSYQQDMAFAPSHQVLMDIGDNYLRELVSTLERDCEAISINADKTGPRPLESLGIPNARKILLEVLAEVGGYGGRVSLRCLKTGGEFDLPVPGADDISAAPKAPKASRRVKGEVTGVGALDQDSCRLEVNRGAPMVVEGLHLKEAVDALLAGAHVEGEKIYENGQAYLVKHSFVASASEVGGLDLGL